MSIHFAPRWLKPIKPTGTSPTPTSDNSPVPIKPVNTLANTPNVPFPALSQGQFSASPVSSTGAREHVLSYSRATHTTMSPNTSADGSYFSNGETNGKVDPNHHPFRYSREQILALWDEDKVKETPIELVEMLDVGDVLVSKSVERPVGLGELSEVEKKLLATSIHPTLPPRRQMSINPSGTTDPPAANGFATRRPPGPPGSGKEATQQMNGRSTGFGGFGRGEGGALGAGVGGRMGANGGGVLSPGNVDSRMPGPMGGGFAGVGKRVVSRGRTESNDAIDPSRSGAAPVWRPTRTLSGSFEGVLGFGNSAAPPHASASGIPEMPSSSAAFEANSSSALDSHWKERVAEGQREKAEQGRDREPEMRAFGTGGGPGWGAGQKKWRLAAGLAAPEAGDKTMHTLNIPMTMAESVSESVMATASGTPVPERDAALEGTSAPGIGLRSGENERSIPTPQDPVTEEREDLGRVQWLYRDPDGREQGPFTGSQMHDWYTHMYFTDDLPLRRLSESNFHSLAQLKASTGNVVQPFLSSVRPRNPPPNLPIPLSVLQAAIGSPVSSDMVDPFGRLGAHSPPTASAPSNTRINPDQPRQQFQQAYQHGYVPDRNTAISPNPFTPQTSFDHQLSSPAASYATSPAQGWASSSIASRLNGGYGSVGMPTPIGSATTPHEQLPALHSPGTGGAAYRDSPENSFVSPPISISANPVSPWAVPPLSQHPQNRQHLQQQQVSPLPPWQPSGPARETWPQQRQEAPYHTSMYDDISSQNPMHSGMDEEVRLETEAEEQPDMGEEELGSSISEPAVETPVEPGSPPPQLPEAVLAPKAAPTVESVWGQKSSPSVKTPSAPPSRKLSLVAPASAQLPLPPSSSGTNAPATKLPPAPASLPPKPVAARQGSVIDVKPMGPQTPENTSTTARPAPWTTGMGKDDKERRISIAGPSLRDIQEGQAKQTAARKRAVAEARAATGSPTQTPDLDEMPQNMTWGLPSQGQNTATVTSPAAASPPSGPVWGGGEAGPKKTLTQIQDEEEKRKVRVAAQARAVQATAGAAAGSKRGYADLAATTTPSIGAGWTTVGSSGKSTPVSTTAPPAPARAPIPAKPASTIPAKPISTLPTIPTTVAKLVKTNGNAEDFAAPSVEFIRWTKQALTGLTVNVDDFIQMLLTFPIDPPAASRPEVLEIISDSVYPNSSTLDGRRFAQEFYTRRKADATRTGVKPMAKISSLADVVQTQPKTPASDAGFKVVKAKGKKKNSAASLGWC